ncbi:MAG: hypothetical protein EZS28_035357 [Streblomastix strix]|uniref:Uncharacterized protein n=1 Tax=Streblomastix strix TaxID=222440 RepID=A0A5J4UED5_9EUKA|nr:MAG: hypothetical protein EZS28_035357 [Streblomastix strix]
MLYEKGVYDEQFARLYAELSAVLIGQLKEIDVQEEIEKDRNKEKYKKFGGIEEVDDYDEDDEEEEDNESKDEFEEKRKRMIYQYKRLYKALQRNALLKKLLIQCVKNEFNDEREKSKQMALKEKQKKSDKEIEKVYEISEELHKVRVKGNVIFAGELVNCGVINTKEGSKFLSALCERTTPGSPNEMNMEVIIVGHLSTRIKFKLQEVLDFYKNGWPKRIASYRYQERLNQLQQKEKEKEKAKEREKDIERGKEQEYEPLQPLKVDEQTEKQKKFK